MPLAGVLPVSEFGYGFSAACIISMRKRSGGMLLVIAWCRSQSKLYVFVFLTVSGARVIPTGRKSVRERRDHVMD
jgi:hypothetical protein